MSLSGEILPCLFFLPNTVCASISIRHLLVWRPECIHLNSVSLTQLLTQVVSEAQAAAEAALQAAAESNSVLLSPDAEASDQAPRTKRSAEHKEHRVKVALPDASPKPSSTPASSSSAFCSLPSSSNTQPSAVMDGGRTNGKIADTRSHLAGTRESVSRTGRGIRQWLGRGLEDLGKAMASVEDLPQAQFPVPSQLPPETGNQQQHVPTRILAQGEAVSQKESRWSFGTPQSHAQAPPPASSRKFQPSGEVETKSDVSPQASSPMASVPSNFISAAVQKVFSRPLLLPSCAVNHLTCHAAPCVPCRACMPHLMVDMSVCPSVY